VPGYRLVDGFIAFDTADVPGTNDGALTGNIPQASRPTKQPVRSYVLLFGISTRPTTRSCIGTVDSLPVTEAFASAPSIRMLFAKLPDGM
jgi:hypothetical protein